MPTFHWKNPKGQILIVTPLRSSEAIPNFVHVRIGNTQDVITLHNSEVEVIYTDEEIESMQRLVLKHSGLLTHTQQHANNPS